MAWTTKEDGRTLGQKGISERSYEERGALLWKGLMLNNEKENRECKKSNKRKASAEMRCSIVNGGYASLMVATLHPLVHCLFFFSLSLPLSRLSSPLPLFFFFAPFRLSIDLLLLWIFMMLPINSFFFFRFSLVWVAETKNKENQKSSFDTNAPRSKVWKWRLKC